MLKIIEELNTIKDIVFVGGCAEVAHGIKDEAKDIDIVVLSLDELTKYNPQTFITKSPFSKSGKRAFFYINDILIDVFIENELPKFNYIDGIKYRSKESIFDFFQSIDIENDETIKDFVLSKLNKIKCLKRD